jgi:cysteine sulfinate desulfinase/cysteine desulfurase-like protein
MLTSISICSIPKPNDNLKIIEHQERGLRGGTENVALIVGMGKAATTCSANSQFEIRNSKSSIP